MIKIKLENIMENFFSNVHAGTERDEAEVGGAGLRESEAMDFAAGLPEVLSESDCRECDADTVILSDSDSEGKHA